MYDFISQQWAIVPIAQGEAPSPRHSHMTVTYKDNMYVFGGYDGSYRADFYEYSFTNEIWRPIPAMTATGSMPRCRYRASCVVHKDQMIMFGGHDGSRHLNDTNIYNFLTSVWTQVPTTDVTPSPRDSHIAVVYGDSMFIFGGSTGEATDDFYELKLGKFRSKWVTIPKNSKNVMIGLDTSGDDDELDVNDSQYSDTPSVLQLPVSPHGEESEFSNINILDERSTIPGMRFCHVGEVHDDCMYIFGGYDGHRRLNDFIRFRFGCKQSMCKIPPSTLITDLKSMVNNEELSDITFQTDENESIYAHKFMLVRCSYFRAMLLGEMTESESKEIKLHDIRKSILISILEYLYTDDTIVNIDSAMDLFQAADRFGVTRLKNICENVMLKSITVPNAATILLAADMYSASALREKCMNFILIHFTEVTKTPAFEEMGRTNIELVFEVLRQVGK